MKTYNTTSIEIYKILKKLNLKSDFSKEDIKTIIKAESIDVKVALLAYLHR